MKILEKLTSALGSPQAFREVRLDTEFLAAVGRWRHAGARVDFGGVDTVQVVFNVSGGQTVDLDYGDRSARSVIRAGTVAVVPPGTYAGVAVTGRADVVQVVLSRGLIEAVSGRPASLAPPPDVYGPRLQAAAAQALVALTRTEPESHPGVDAAVRTMAFLLSLPAAPPSRPFRGGLSASARRRVNAVMDDRLRADGCSPLALGELAEAAGLSVHHFVKAFRSTEGETPYARVLVRRIDLALSLLLRADARVDEVADATGFSSPSHFVSTFRRHTGVTPGAVRDAARA